MRFIGLFVLYIAITITNAQTQCSDSRTTCINIRRCDNIITILRDSPKPLTSQILQMLRNAQCGFEGNDLMVCCVNQHSIITQVQQTASSSTTTTTTTTTRPVVRQEDGPSPPDVTNHPNLRLLDESCGPINQPKVIGGDKTGIFEYPWMALIAYDTGKPTPEFRCGGTIISKRYILTAAHCVTELPTGVRSVRVGDHDISKERDCDYEFEIEIECAERYQDFAVESIHYHPGYNQTTLQNDIALIRLNDSIDFRPVSVKPICLPIGSAARIDQKKAIVTGWGATESGPRSVDLLQANLPLVANDQCKEIYKRSMQIWYKQMCAGGLRNVNSCFGDSGGPLQAYSTYNGSMRRFVQHGVISYGTKKCGTAGIPGVFTRVAYYLDWILNTMAD